MAQSASSGRLVSVDEYLQIEAASDVRHEYVSGQLFALAGASDRHNQIVVNLVAMIRPQVRGTDCRVFANDMLLQVSEQQFYYPNLMVVCDPTDSLRQIRTRPCLVIEVLSPTTTAIDQREKAFAYKQVRSVTSYLIVHQDGPSVEHHYRLDGNLWGIEELTTTDTVSLPCGDLRIDVAGIYEDVDFG